MTLSLSFILVVKDDLLDEAGEALGRERGPR